MSIGVIGGSGVYDLEDLTNVHKEKVKTPFGVPSDSFVCGRMEGREVCFLPRHGKKHHLLPSEINHRANIFAMKMLGVEQVISVSAVGSLKEDLRPRDMVLPDQYFDRTKDAPAHTFFGEGLVAHVSFGEPACAELRRMAAESSRRVMAGHPDWSGVRVHDGGTYVNMAGPAFSTKAESKVYRHFGFDVIGMTSLAEAKLCREAEMCYQSLAMVTDYDCWREEAESVTVEMIIGNLMANTSLAKAVLKDLFLNLPEKRTCRCGQSLKSALITSAEFVSAATKKKLAPIIGKYMGLKKNTGKTKALKKRKSRAG